MAIATDTLEEADAIAGQTSGVARGADLEVGHHSRLTTVASHVIVVGNLAFIAATYAGAKVEMVEVGRGAAEAVCGGGAIAGQA